MFDLHLQSADHSRHYFVSVSPSGWELRLEEDLKLLQSSLYQDWHRVERAVAKVEREVGRLIDSGWRVVGRAS